MRASIVIVSLSILTSGFIACGDVTSGHCRVVKRSLSARLAAPVRVVRKANPAPPRERDSLLDNPEIIAAVGVTTKETTLLRKAHRELTEAAGRGEPLADLIRYAYKIFRVRKEMAQRRHHGLVGKPGEVEMASADAKSQRQRALVAEGACLEFLNLIFYDLQRGDLLATHELVGQVINEMTASAEIVLQLGGLEPERFEVVDDHGTRHPALRWKTSDRRGLATAAKKVAAIDGEVKYELFYSPSLMIATGAFGASVSHHRYPIDAEWINVSSQSVATLEIDDILGHEIFRHVLTRSFIAKGIETPLQGRALASERLLPGDDPAYSRHISFDEPFAYLENVLWQANQIRRTTDEKEKEEYAKLLRRRAEDGFNATASIQTILNETRTSLRELHAQSGAGNFDSVILPMGEEHSPYRFQVPLMSIGERGVGVRIRRLSTGREYAEVYYMDNGIFTQFDFVTNTTVDLAKRVLQTIESGNGTLRDFQLLLIEIDNRAAALFEMLEIYRPLYRQVILDATPSNGRYDYERMTTEALKFRSFTPVSTFLP